VYASTFGGADGGVDERDRRKWRVFFFMLLFFFFFCSS